MKTKFNLLPTEDTWRAVKNHCRTTDNKDFTENYPDYAEMVNQPYEDIVAFHTLIMIQLASLGVTLVSAWTEPMYTGRGYYPFEAMDFDTYRDKVAHPEKIFQKSNKRRGAE